MATSPRYNPNLVEHHFDRSRDGRRVPAGRAARQPRHGRSLPAGLDVQARHRRRRARLRHGHAALAVRRPRLLHRVRQAGLQLRRRVRPRAVRQRHARGGAPALDQLGVLQRRQEARRAEDPRVRASSSASTRRPASRRPARSSGRAGSTARQPLLPEARLPGRPGPARLRPGAAGVTPLQMAMVAAAIANGGVVMQPYVVDRILRPDGKVLRPRSRRSSGARSRRQTAAS